ncbi:YgjP-like metallopeptidase domain-containing protein [Candidatus Nitrotoga fabula]|nr:YgjP-like metallopeptidase domain-containing protein [Candidatus Nitrotoga fabula]
MECSLSMLPAVNKANYLAGYPVVMVEQVQRLIEQDRLARVLLHKYPGMHTVRTDKTLYEYVMKIKEMHLRNAGQLDKVVFDAKLHVVRNALGMHSSKSMVQGARLRNRCEIRISSLFRWMPLDFLRMIVVHELAHIREREHGKSFYQLCSHMEPAYHQLEFDLRVYLTYLETGGLPLWKAG